MKLTLRNYQHDAGAALRGSIAQGLRRLLVKKPTGTGKTVWFAALLELLGEWLATLPKKKGAKLLVIAHREELLDQALEKIQRANPGLMCSIEQGDRHANRYSDVVIASIQTLAAMKFRRLERFMAHHDPAIVVIDEAHHAAAASYRTTIARLGFLPTEVSSATGEVEAATHDDVKLMTKALEGWDQQAPKDRVLVGVTATPNRTDAIGLGCVFQSIAYSYDLKQAIEDGWLVPIKPWAIETAESLDDVKTARGDFHQGELADAVNNDRRNRLALESWKVLAGDRPTIAFTVDVAHAHAVADLFNAGGVRAAAISGETPKETRRQILEDYRRGRIQVLSNCMVLTEGTDLPTTACILHLKPTKSATLYEQMTGRGLRLHPDDPAGVARRAAAVEFIKPNCIVIDLVDIARRHSLQAAPVLYGLPPGIKTKGDDLGDLEKQIAKVRELAPTTDLDELLRSKHYTIQELLDRASTFDAFNIPEMGALGEALSMDWLKVTEKKFILQYPWADGIEIVAVEADMLGHFDVSITLRPANGEIRQRTIAAQVPTPIAALKLAETFIRDERGSVTAITDKAAGWKRRPASEKQIALLTRLRVPVPKNCTMGQAGRLINMAKSRTGWGRRR